MDFDYQGIYGFDVSMWQDLNSTPQQIDFVKMKNSGARFCGVKVGQGTWNDPDFKYNWLKSKDAGLIRMGYWFCDGSIKPKIQAQKYWELLQLDFDPSEMQWADYENGSWTDWYNLYVFISEFQRLSGLPNEKIGVYTGYPYWTAHSPATVFSKSWFEKYQLWLAWYTTSVAYVKVPSPWKEVLIWQDGTPTINVGQESPTIDHDMFNGGEIKFKKYLGGSPAITPSTPLFPASVYIDAKEYKGVL